MRSTRAEILEVINQVLRDRLQIAKPVVDEDTMLLGQGLGIDSIEALQLVLGIETRFEIEIDDAALTPEQFRTVGDVVALVARSLEGR